ncbi:MAG: cytochrome ubiquinol oxidase subunit I, partial [Nitrospirales bacterium]
MNRRFLIFLIGLSGLTLLAGLAYAQVIPERPAPQFPGLGNRTAMWVIAQLHVLFAAFILGAPIFVSVCEILGVKWNDHRYDRLARDILKISMMLYSLAALTGGALLLGMVTLYPNLSTWYMSHLFELVAIAYPILFIGETIILYIYYYTWDLLQNEKKGRHVALGLLLNTFGI